MIFIYIQTLEVNKKTQVSFRITVGFQGEEEEGLAFNFRPQITIPVQVYKANQVDRMEVLASPLFCDIADELIDLFSGRQLVFLERNQFYLLRHQFKIIGYNFNVKPIFLMHGGISKEDITSELLSSLKSKHGFNSTEFAETVVTNMFYYFNGKSEILEEHKAIQSRRQQFDLSEYKMTPRVYFFLNEFEDVLYIGKAKNIRKRLQSHFSGKAKGSNINYSEVISITVEYTGNDIIAQLVESEHIKKLKPIYNTQQIVNPKPFVINRGKTAKGISNLSITKKVVDDNLAELYFNRNSVKQALKNFCSDYDLCRKHCGLERKKGACSKATLENKSCVCNGDEAIINYNKRFDIALYQFDNSKIRKIYKLKGRTKTEDAFIYLINGIYAGYGFIDKEERVSTVNDVLGHLIPQENNYDTSRIVGGLGELVRDEDVLVLRH